MKKSRFALLSVLSLVLSGCGRSTVEESSVPKSFISQNETSSVGGSSVAPTSSSEAPKESSLSQISSEPASSTSQDSSSISSSIYDSDWPSAIVDLMVQYLGGESGVIPFIDIGAKSTSGFWVKSSYEYDDYYDYVEIPAHLEIIGSTAWDDAMLTETKATYEAVEGWTVTVSGTTLTAKNSALGLTVTLENSDGYPLVKAYYNEPFNPAKGTAWQQTTLDVFSSAMGGHNLPYFYTGTTNETVSTPSSGSFTITGGKWDDQIITLAQNAFDADNADGIAWTVTVTGSTLTAKKVYADGYTVSVEVSKNSSGVAQVKVSYAEPFIAPKEEDRVWPSAIQSDMNDHFGVVLPYLYLGVTSGIDDKWFSSFNELDIHSNGTWNDQILDLAEQYLAADSTDWTVERKTEYGDTYLDAIGVIGKIQFELKLKKSSSYGAILEIYASYLYDPDHQATDWTDDTKQLFTDHFNGYDFPYVYLGTEKEKSSYSTYSDEIEIDGGGWDDQIITDLTAALNADDGLGTAWTITFSSTTGKSLNATKTSADNSITLTLKLSYYDGTFADYVKLEISIKKFTPPTGADAKWSDATKTTIESYLGTGNELPYIYLASDSPSARVSYYSDDLEITGGDWDDRLLDLTVTSLTDAGASHIVKDDSAKTVTAVVTLADGSYAWLKLRQYSGDAELDVKKYDAVTCDNTGSWSKDVNTALATYFGGYALPYMDLGNANPSASYSSYSQYEELTFSKYSIGYLFNAKTVLEGDGWTLTYGENSYGPTLTATKADDNYTYKIVFASDYNDNLVADFYLKEAFKIPTGDDAKWNDTVINVLNKYLWSDDTTNYLPYFYTGSMNPTCSYGSTYQSAEKDFVGGSFDSQVLALAKAAFEADNTARAADIAADASKAWTFSYDKTLTYAKNDEGAFIATRKANDGKHTITVKVFENSSGKAAFWVYYN